MTTRTTILAAIFVAGATLVGGARHAPANPPQTPAPVPQQPALTFRASANYVELDAIVTDANGRIVRDLRADEFDVVEDGKPRPLSICSFVQIPVDRPDPLLFRSSIVEPDVASNEKPFDGRVFMFVLDGYHVGASRGALVRSQLRTFIEKYLGENDLAAVIHIGYPVAGQEFTSNKRLLLAAVDRFAGQGLRSSTVDMVEDAKLNQDNPIPGIVMVPKDTEEVERGFMARESLDSVKRLSEYMGTLSGRRKALLFFSEGIDYETIETPQLITIGASMNNNRGEVRAAEMDMIAAATRANVSMYTIDPRGLTTGLEEAVVMGTLPANGEGSNPLYAELSHTFSTLMADERRRALESLRLFADSTGGLALVDTNDIDGAFRRIIDDNSAYYVLGYESPDTSRNGRFHRVSVKVTRPGLVVRTRNGYYAPSDKASKPIDDVSQMLGSPMPISGLGMRAHVGVLTGLTGRSRAHLTVEFTGRDLAFKTVDGLFTDDVEIGYYALDMAGKVAWNERQILHLKLLPASHGALPRDGLRYVTEFDLPPGRYQLRVAAKEQIGGRTGSVFYDLEVPDTSLAPLAMNDLLLTTALADRTLTGRGTASVAGKLLGQTTTARDFAREDTLTVLAGIFDRDVARPHSVDLSVTVRADDGAEIFTRQDVRNSQELGGEPGLYPYTLSMPLRSLKPGRYVMAVEARSRLSSADPVRKEIEFRVKQ